MKHVKVLLDTSYLTDYDYYRMWNAIIQHRTHEEIANIFEVKVNFDGVEKGGATKTADLTANQKLLEAAKSKPAVSADAPAKDKDTGKKKPGSVPKKGAPSKPASKAEESAPNFVMGGDGKPIYLIPKASIAGLSGELDLIKDPKTRGTKKGKDEIFRNHGHFLPNLGNSYFAEFNTNCLSEGASARIIWDETHDVFYITGTHYNPWMDKSGKLRNPFYKIVE